MRLRPWLIIASLGVFVGCVSGDLDAPVGEIVAAPGSPVLEAEPAPREGVQPNESVELRVRYRDAAGRGIAGIEVDFALSEVAPGASLAPWRTVTDDDGVASTRLTVGSMPGQLVVRAGARQTGTVYMQVHVGEVVKTHLAVRVAYAGTRNVSAFIVSAVPTLACAQALASGAVGDVVHRFGGGAQEVGFELDARERSAIVAWGRDASGGQLARGCTEFAPSSTAASEASLVLALDDTPLRIDQPVPVALRLRVTESAARLDALAREVVSTMLAPYAADAQAALYLEAIAARLNVAPATLDARRASLTANLARADVGPVPLADTLGAVLARRGAGLVLETRFDVDASPTVEALHALALDDGALVALAPRPALTLRTKLATDEARVVVESLRVELSLGAFGKALLRGLDADETFVDQLEAAAGCRAVVGPWTESEGLGTAAVGEAACTEVMADVRARYDEALDALVRAPLELSGTLVARDRSEDGAIDELGPSPIAGSWIDDDPVQGEVRAPVQTTLVL
ncbi:MAG: Ig-like domain-containing protein [Polyangiales bacterium]